MFMICIWIKYYLKLYHKLGALSNPLISWYQAVWGVYISSVYFYDKWIIIHKLEDYNMIIKTSKTIIAVFVTTSLYANSMDIDYLLESYKVESDLSKITKSESNGFVDIFTREDMERMQARTLADIMKLFTVPYISRSNINSTMFVKPSQKSMPTSAVRIFVNDHDITASVYQSGALICGSITLDAIDHIEVYRSSASVEFGNEPSSIVIKLYTKDPSREEGGKVRVSGDGDGSSYISGYIGQTLQSDISYFVYGNTNQMKRDVYYNQGYPIKSDSTNANLYAGINYKSWDVEFGYFQTKTDPFLGMGKDVTPSGGSTDTRYSYIHLTKKFANEFRLQASIDLVDSQANMQDMSGIYAGDFGFVQDYSMDVADKIYSLILDKTFKTYSNSLYIGGFVKHKHTEVKGDFDTNSTDFRAHYNLYSLYIEDKYNFTPTTMGILSLKRDYYRYEEDEIDDKNEYIFRLGLIKNIANLQLKTFYTRTYYTSPIISLYSDGTNAPLITNRKLKSAQPTLYSLGARYKEKNQLANFRVSYIELSNPIKYDTNAGFINGDKTFFIQYEVSYTYKFDLKNKLTVDAYHGRRKDAMEYSPPYGGHIIVYNSYKKFDFFNMLDYRAPYSDYGIDVEASYDWTSSVRYHYTKDLLFGIKGENILDKGYKQVYKGLSYPISVFDRKVWFNVEYQF